MAEQPFAGIRVVEFGQFVAVPVAAQLLADGGAEVVKVESLEGDPIRSINPLATGESRFFLSRNNGKHSLPLALSDPSAAPVIEALVASADVVLLNLRPGLAENLGLGSEALIAKHPRLIVGAVSAFGTEGPEAHEAGMDLVVQARSGLMAANGRIMEGRPAAGDPVSADFMCAMTLSFGISAALLRRERTGRGGVVDTSLLQAAMMLTSTLLVRSEDHDKSAHDEALGRLAEMRNAGASYEEQVMMLRPANRMHMFRIYYRTYVTADSFIAVACGSHGLRVRFAAAIGIDDPALTGDLDGDVNAHYESLAQRGEQMVAGRPSDHWVALLRDAGIPVSKVRMPIELYDDEQVRANGFLREYDHPQAGRITVTAPPLNMDEDGFVSGPPTAPFGSETHALLAGLGFSQDEIDALVAGEITHRGKG